MAWSYCSPFGTAIRGSWCLAMGCGWPRSPDATTTSEPKFATSKPSTGRPRVVDYLGRPGTAGSAEPLAALLRAGQRLLGAAELGDRDEQHHEPHQQHDPELDEHRHVPASPGHARNADRRVQV